VNVTGGESMTLHEINEAVTVVVDAAGHDANVIFGAVIDEHMETGSRSRLDRDGIRKGGREAEARSPCRHPAHAPAASDLRDGPARRAARTAAVRPPSLEDPAPEEEGVVAAARPGYRMSAGSPRRPFGGGRSRGTTWTYRLSCGSRWTKARSTRAQERRNEASALGLKTARAR